MCVDVLQSANGLAEDEQWQHALLTTASQVSKVSWHLHLPSDHVLHSAPDASERAAVVSVCATVLDDILARFVVAEADMQSRRAAVASQVRARWASLSASRRAAMVFQHAHTVGRAYHTDQLVGDSRVEEAVIQVRPAVSARLCDSVRGCAFPAHCVSSRVSGAV